jgi:hypothetical protein
MQSLFLKIHTLGTGLKRYTQDKDAFYVEVIVHVAASITSA